MSLIRASVAAVLLPLVVDAGVITMTGPRLVINSSEFAGLTPTHFIDNHADVSGAQSGDLDTANSPLWSECTVIANPCTMGRAMANADDNNIVGMLPGRYVGQDEDERFTPTFRTTNSGTAGNLITFVARFPAAYLGGTLSSLVTDPASYVAAVEAHPNVTELTNGVTSWTGAAGSNGSPVIGCPARSYVRWIGPFIDGAESYSHADTGPVTANGNSVGCELHQAVVVGRTMEFVDNYSAVRLESADGFVAKNNVFRTFYSGSSFLNQSSLVTYAARNLTWEHNDISDVGNGIWIKTDNADNGDADGNSGVIRWNRVRDVTGGITVATVHTGETLNVVENLIYNAAINGLQFHTNNGAANARNTHFTYNTVHNAQIGICVSGITNSGYEIEGNILSVGSTNSNYSVIDGGNSGLDCSFTGTNSQFTVKADNHAYRNGAALRFVWDGLNVYTTTGTFEAASEFTGTTSGDPLFTNAANGDFTLQGGSPAAGKGAYANGNLPGIEASPSL